MSITTFFQPSRSKRRLTKFTGPWQFTQRLMTSCFTPSRSSGSCGIQSAGVRIGEDRLSARSSEVFFPGAISISALAPSACPPSPADTSLFPGNSPGALESAHLDRFRGRGALRGQDERQTEKRSDDFEHGNPP